MALPVYNNNNNYLLAPYGDAFDHDGYNAR